MNGACLLLLLLPSAALALNLVPRASHGAVAFHANAQDKTVPLYTGRPIPFDHTLVNAGSAYNTQTGKFTAPVAGLYLFWTQIESTKPGVAITMFIFQSGKPISAGYMETNSDLADDTGSAMVATHLTKGEEVWVEIEKDFAMTVFPSSYFGGVLLYADDGTGPIVG
ncbi:complement C1q tumor necrosis factor-related protein 5-like [Haliotis rubra]|uniref:complement C1q tumor necrosis factor-related protein 5-like n=1 Tax=Haliotis rubra TaxID=36100 RepID=UPI001EE5DC6A|nr:complement C1q tumor necrosis factor-related protein 5-like [Haliotis rubra]